jgi:hypothetical protein
MKARTIVTLAAAIVTTLVLGQLTGQPAVSIAFGSGLLVAWAGGRLSRFADQAVVDAPGTADGQATAGWTEFHRELARARRFNGEFAVMRWPLRHEPADGDRSEIMGGIEGRARRIDRVWVDGSDVLVLLPETSRAAAEVVLERIRSVPALAEITPTMASFPQDGITSGALLSVIDDQEQAVAPRSISVILPESWARVKSEAAAVAEPDLTATEERAMQHG